MCNYSSTSNAGVRTSNNDLQSCRTVNFKIPRPETV